MEGLPLLKKQKPEIKRTLLLKDIWLNIASVSCWPELIVLQMVSKEISKATRIYYQNALNHLSSMLNSRFQIKIEKYLINPWRYENRKIIFYFDILGDPRFRPISCYRGQNFTVDDAFNSKKPENVIRFLNICLYNIPLENLDGPKNLFRRYKYIRKLFPLFLPRKFDKRWKRDDM
jgi:hypothetical protein